MTIKDKILALHKQGIIKYRIAKELNTSWVYVSKVVKDYELEKKIKELSK
jgi:hypothetical protein